MDPCWVLSNTLYRLFVPFIKATFPGHLPRYTPIPLQASMESGDPGKMVGAIRAVKLDRLREKRDEAELTNELRSGERGKLAQQQLWNIVARQHASLLGFNKGWSGAQYTVRTLQSRFLASTPLKNCFSSVRKIVQQTSKNDHSDESHAVQSLQGDTRRTLPLGTDMPFGQRFCSCQKYGACGISCPSTIMSEN